MQARLEAGEDLHHWGDCRMAATHDTQRVLADMVIECAATQRDENRNQKVKDNWELLTYKFTTDNGAGTARLKAGQYRGAYMLGLHQGKYKALRQCGPVVVYRDFKNDGVYQEERTERGVFGINIHKAGVDSIRVDRWSEGCQVFKRTQDFNKFMAICEISAEIWGNSFTYTLINSSDLTR
jgi:hypothetical protein